MRNLIRNFGVVFAQKSGSTHGYRSTLFPEDVDMEDVDISNVTEEEKERNKKTAQKIQKRKMEEKENPTSISELLHRGGVRNKTYESERQDKKPKMNSHVHFKPIKFSI